MSRSGPDSIHASADSTDRVFELAQHARQRILDQLGRRIVGQSEVIERLLIALFAGGHCLFVGVPGLAKTLLISSLADVLDLKFSRIQFTPDLMPADVTGTDILHDDPDGGRVFRFAPGPVFAHVVLADEINRTPPKTQAALLQAMQEKRVTVGGKTHALNQPFVVFATQNPIEQEGTYPLPEAQLDRFMFHVDVGYPNAAEEEEIVRRTTNTPAQDLEHVLDPDQIMTIQRLVPQIPAAEHVIRYAVALCRASRPQEQSAPDLIRRFVGWGAGPRAAQFLTLASKAKALLDGRAAVRIEDLQQLAIATLQHRLVLNFRAEAEGIRAPDLVAHLLESVPLPK